MLVTVIWDSSSVLGFLWQETVISLVAAILTAIISIGESAMSGLQHSL
jgi:hypothetical protein